MYNVREFTYDMSTLDYSFISCRSVGSISLKKSSLLGHFVFLLRLILGHFFLLRLILGHFCFLLRLILGHFFLLLRLILGHFCFFVNAHERRSSFLYFCKRKNIHTHTNVGARSEFYWTLDYSFISCRSVGSISFKKKLSPWSLCFFAASHPWSLFFVNAHERRSSFLYFCKRKNIHWSHERRSSFRILLDTRLFIHQLSIGRFYFF